MDQELCPSGPVQQEEAETCRMDIAIERTDNSEEYRPSLTLTQIWIFQAEATCFGLIETSPGRWKAIGLIKLSDAVTPIHCVVKCEDGEDFSSVYIDSDRMRTKNPGLDDRHRKDMQVCDTRVRLTMSGMLGIVLEHDLLVEDLAYLNAALIGVNSFKAFQKTRSPARLNKAVDSLRRAVNLCPSDHEWRPCLLNGLADCLSRHFRVTGNLVDLDEAILVQQAAMSITPEDQEWREAMLMFLSGLLWLRFDHVGEIQDLAGAISLQRLAVQLIPPARADLPLQLNKLGHYLTCSFARTGHFPDIDDAISAFRHAVDESAHTGHGDLYCYLHSKGIVLSGRFERTGHLPDIEESVTAHQHAVELTGAGHPDLPMCLHGLGTSLTLRWGRTGDFSDIEEGILALQRAVNLTPEGDSNFPGYLCQLGSLLTDRFHRTKEISDLTEAIYVHQRAVDATPEGDQTLRTQLNSLGSALVSRWICTQDPMDLDEGIGIVRQAIDVTPSGDPEFSTYIHNLGIWLSFRWGESRQSLDLEESISLQEMAVELARVAGHDACLSRSFSSLGGVLKGRYRETGDIGDINKAISSMEQALELTPRGHALLPTYLGHLGEALVTRSVHTAQLDCTNPSPTLLLASLRDLRESMTRYGWAATCRIGSPLDRLHAAKKWARQLMALMPTSLHILVALDTALDLLALIGGLEQSIRTCHVQIRDHADTALEAAAAACSLDRPDKALEWLEQGGSLVWNQINHLRTPLDSLHNYDPSPAGTLMQVSKRLEIAGSSRELSHIDMPLQQKISLQEEAITQVKLTKQWEQLLHQVRAIPGFDSFLQPAKCITLLQNLPESGPIIVINVHEWRCDAIALLAGLDEPLHITLPTFSEQKAKQYQCDLGLQLKSRGLRMRGEDLPEAGGERSVRAAGGYRGPRGTPVRRILRGLWTDVVKPILDTLAILKFERRYVEKPPRIWWCPTGPLSFLPLHAAGIYGPGVESESVLDYVVSSYTPTVSTLTGRVRNNHAIDESVSGLFLTSQPKAPGVAEIPGTTSEVNTIYQKAVENGIRALKVEGSDLTVNECLRHLEEYSSVHLACHGYQNPEESLQSKFCFHNGTLDLATILRMDLKNADLAFLSACQTSTGDENLSEEAVHLAAGMLAAGYCRVVATMWSIGDTTAQVVANSFYEWLLSRRGEGSGSGFDRTHSAYALHHAIQKLREDRDDTDGLILAWAPFVHFGY